MIDIGLQEYNIEKQIKFLIPFFNNEKRIKEFPAEEIHNIVTNIKYLQSLRAKLIATDQLIEQIYAIPDKEEPKRLFCTEQETLLLNSLERDSLNIDDEIYIYETYLKIKYNLSEEDLK